MSEHSTTAADVRLRPSMFLGATDDPFAAFLEVLSNAFDEYLAGRARAIEITLHADHGVTITDDGGGIERAVLAAALTSYHDTPTLDRHRPHAHLGGARGLGLFPVAAVCDVFEVETVHAGEAHRWQLARGAPVHELVSTPHAGPTGTRVRCAFDATLFRSVVMPRARLVEQLQTLMDLSPGLHVTLKDEAHVLTSPRGILSRVNGDHAMVLEGTVDDTRVTVALAWRPPWDVRLAPRIESFVNWRRTTDHGTHVTGMLDGLATVQTALELRRPLKERLDACVAIVTSDVAWGSPTQDRLLAPGLRPLVASVVRRELRAKLDAHPAIEATLRARRYRS